MKVVILGGGFCGAYVAKKLDKQKNFEVVLIDKKEYFEYSPSLWKLLADPSYHTHIKVPFVHVLRHTRIITDPLTRVTPEFVEVYWRVNDDGLFNAMALPEPHYGFFGVVAIAENHVQLVDTLLNPPLKKPQVHLPLQA